MKMNQMYTTRYENGVSISHPVIFLWKGAEGIFFVDFVNESVGYTLKAFPTYKEARSFADAIGQMEESEFSQWYDDNYSIPLF